ncbi:MAG: hypothetical protein FWE16_04240 [Firmicutes bacterium]|nr:hypothetical protein [Bacillota bacterium]
MNKNQIEQYLEDNNLEFDRINVTSTNVTIHFSKGQFIVSMSYLAFLERLGIIDDSVMRSLVIMPTDEYPVKQSN